MKKAFTLVEILITVSIIALLIVVAVPNLSIYKQTTEFQNTQNEIEVLVSDLWAMSRNAEQGYLKYSLKIDAGKVSLNKVDAAGTTVEIESVLPIKNQLFAPQNSVSEIFCLVPGNDCFERTNISGTITDTKLSSSTGSKMFLKIIDNNFSPVKHANFSIFGSPLRVFISNE